MTDSIEPRVAELPPPDVTDRLRSGGSLLLLTGTLYREVQVKHPRCARFSVQNEQGLFFVKVYRAALVSQARSFEPGAEIGVVGEMHSFVSRRCKNHHVFVRANALFEMTEPHTERLAKIAQMWGSLLTE
jgi:hypothetical protein